VDPSVSFPREVVDISVAGGPSSQVLIDTGSTGILLPPQDVNPATLGAPTGSGVAHYGAGSETFTTYTASVNLGNGIVTAPTTVGVITSYTPSGSQTTYPGTDGIAIMGVGLNTGGASGNPGPLPTSPVQSLPGVLGQGVLVNAPGSALQFGANPLPAYASISGAPVTNPYVTITAPNMTSGSGIATGAFIDSGGTYGEVPSSLMPTGQQTDTFVPAGDIISVYTSQGGTLLYSQPVTGTTQGPFVSSSFNSGIYPFTQTPIYLSYSPSGVGTTYFDT
jgi:PE-PGRS C-terminal aspartyl peptidase-like domain